VAAAPPAPLHAWWNPYRCRRLPGKPVRQQRYIAG
jgi:hypothetical protein